MLSTMKVAELRAVAEEFGVDVSQSKTKALLLAQLAEEGVTDEVFASLSKGTEKVGILAATPRESEEGDVLVSMTRANPTFEVLGYKFTKEHPYVAMSPGDAQSIFDSEFGFRTASPNEVKEYYS